MIERKWKQWKKDDLTSSPISRGNDSVTVLWEKQISNAGDSSRRISKMPYKVEKFPKEVKNPWRLRESAMEEPSINKLHEQSILLREGRDWGLFHPSETKSSRKGGKDLQTADRKPRVPSEKKGRFASLQIPSHQRGRKFFFQKTSGQTENLTLSSSEVSSRKNDGGSRTELAGRQICVNVPR